MALAERWQTDRYTVSTMRGLHERYSPGPVRLALPGRSMAVVLRPEDVHTVLESGPDPFSPASVEKQAALSQFQPHGVLISTGRTRAERREVNERILEPGNALHRLAPDVHRVVREEATRLLARVEERRSLDWAEFAAAWWPVVRRIVLGDDARDDEQLTNDLFALRGAGNWSYLLPRRRVLRRRFLARVHHYVGKAQPGSLAGTTREMNDPNSVDLAGQFPHWLFAFDAAGMATMRTIALLATHPEALAAARAEIDRVDLRTPQQLRYLRACVLEAVRLWPTTPVILRDSTTDTSWPGGTVPAGTALLVLSSYFHRNTSITPTGDTFAPEIWLDGRAAEYPALVPFSDGPAQCPGRNLVLFVTSTLLADLFSEHSFRLHEPHRLEPSRPLPATLDNFSLSYDAQRLHTPAQR
jgi:cytochrome P450